jgi:hypothetical protein
LDNLLSNEWREIPIEDARKVFPISPAPPVVNPRRRRIQVK